MRLASFMVILVLGLGAAASHPDAWDRWMSAGETAAREGRGSAAEGAFRNALEEAERSGRAIRIARSTEALADLYATVGRSAEAEPLYHDVIERWKTILGPNQPRLGIPLHNLAVLYLRECRVDEALPLVTEVAALWEETLGPDHPDRLSALRSEAALLRRCDRPAEAGKLEALVESSRS